MFTDIQLAVQQPV